MAYDWAAGLGGLGAALQGNYPQWQVAETDRKQGLAELDEKRRLAMLQDFRGVLVRAKAGDLGGAQSLLQDRLQVLNEIGGDPSHSAEVLRYLQEGRADEAIAGLQSIDDIAVARGELPSMALGGEGTPSNVQEFMFWQSLPEDQQKQYLQVKRAQQIIDMGGGVSGAVYGNQAAPITQVPGQTIDQARADVAGAEASLEGATSAAGEYGKLGAQLQVAPAIAAATTEAELTTQAAIKPQMEADIAAAVDSAKAGVLNAAKAKDAGQLFSAYDVAINNLGKALGSTSTGPLIGMLPALTENAQAAKGAQQVLAVAIKGLIRTAGEGVWTDKDQQMITEMMPTREDKPGSRAQKLVFIDQYIRAKLGQPGAGAAPAPATGSPEVPEYIDRVAPPSIKFLGFE